MVGRSEPARQVTLGADSVAIRSGNQLARMWIVAVAARHTSPVHFALQERTVDVDLVLNLSVREVQTVIK